MWNPASFQRLTSCGTKDTEADSVINLVLSFLEQASAAVAADVHVLLLIAFPAPPPAPGEGGD
jgi:hypothetical protein